MSNDRHATPLCPMPTPDQLPGIAPNRIRRCRLDLITRRVSEGALSEVSVAEALTPEVLSAGDVMTLIRLQDAHRAAFSHIHDGAQRWLVRRLKRTGFLRRIWSGLDLYTRELLDDSAATVSELPRWILPEYLRRLEFQKSAQRWLR